MSRWVLMAIAAVFFLPLGLAISSCGGGGHPKQCTGGVDPGGRACTVTRDCAVKCVCERSNHKRYTVSTGQCRENHRCTSAEVVCIEACLVSLGSYTGDFCTRPTPHITPAPTHTRTPVVITVTPTP